MLNEITTIYSDLTAGDLPSLPPLPIQYADYAVWQRTQLGKQAFARDLAYWKQQLDDAPLALNLPADRPRPAIQTYQGARQSFTLPIRLSKQLQELSRGENVTLSAPDGFLPLATGGRS